MKKYPFIFSMCMVWVLVMTLGQEVFAANEHFKQRSKNDSSWSSIVGAKDVPIPEGFRPLGFNAGWAEEFGIIDSNGNIMRRTLGSTSWTNFTDGSNDYAVSIPAGYQGYGFDGDTFYINPSTGTLKWRMQQDYGFYDFGSVPAIPDGYVPVGMFGIYNGGWYEYVIMNPSTGDVKKSKESLPWSDVGNVGPIPQGYSIAGVRYITSDNTNRNVDANNIYIVIIGPATPINKAPNFVESTSALAVNQNASDINIHHLLHVSDTDTNQVLTWSQSAAPSHGTLMFSNATASSGSSDIFPGGNITYTPTVGYVGPDSFTVQVSDGAATATRTIHVTVSDVTEPIVLGSGSSSVSSISATVTATSNEAATMYYVITTSSISPSELQVMAGQDHLGTLAVQSGNGGVTENTEKDFHVSGLAAGTQYYVYFVAKDSSNNLSSVSGTSFTTTAPISDFTSTAKTSTTATFAWTATSGATGIRIEQSLAGQNNWSTAAMDPISTNAATATVTGLSADTQYDFRLVVTGGANEGNSNTANVRTNVELIDAVMPNITLQPLNQTLTVGDNFSQSVEASVNGEGTLTYQWYSNNMNSNSGGTIITGATDKTYEVPTTTAGTTYYFVVVTNTNNNATGNKTAVLTSSTSMVTVNPGLSYAITGIDDITMMALQAGYQSGTQETKTITLTRTGTGDLAHVAVTLSETNANDFVITQPSVTTLTDSTPSTTFTIKAKDGLAAGTYTAAVTVSADNMTNETFTVTQVVNAANLNYTLGDVNNDGAINMTDVYLIHQYIKGKITFTETQLLAANVNRDTLVNATDAQLIQSYYLKKISGF